MSTLTEIATRYGTHERTKSIVPGMYDLYERYLHDLANKPVTLLELGVCKGDSLKTFATRFPTWKIIGFDLEDHNIDYSDCPNISFRQGDQSDAHRLNEICAELAPHGVDVIIDDASHFGNLSLASYRILLPRLKPGGLYFIEDWATGYRSDWPDGAQMQKVEQVGNRIISHDFGMVGFTKHLVDEVLGNLTELHVYRQTIVVRKVAPFEA